MAKLNLTPQQSAAVENRGGSLLVSAAAGSGKTKVLVERLFRYVTEDHCHIDDFLIITYTKAAAAELRSKILTKIGSQIRIILQIGRLIAEGHQLSGVCPHRHEVPQPDVFGVREKTVRDVVGVKRGGEVGSGCGMMI